MDNKISSMKESDKRSTETKPTGSVSSSRSWLSQLKPTFSLFDYWLTESIAFILLPLVVYLLVFFALRIDLAEIIKLPEWMFISIAFFGDVARRLISYYREYQGFELKAVRTIGVAIIGIVVSAVLLVFSTIAQYYQELILSPEYYLIQLVWFFIAVSYSAQTSIWIGRRMGHDRLLGYLIPENKVQEEEQAASAVVEPSEKVAETPTEVSTEEAKQGLHL